MWITYTLKHRDAIDLHSSMEVFLRGYRCQAGCATSTAGDLVEVGTDIYAHLAHPALAVRKVGANPIEFTVVRAAKVYPDCDGDGDLTGPPSYDETDRKAHDLVAYTFSNPGNLGVFTSTGSKNVSINALNVCGDRGMTSARYQGGETWACFTHTPLVGQSDRVGCASTVGGTATAWGAPLDLPAPPFGLEDHPSLDFIGSDRIVATSNRDDTKPVANHNLDQIRIAFPDHVGSTPIIQIPGLNWSNHPVVDVQEQTGLVQVVYHRGLGGNAQLLYTTCTVNMTANPPVLCDSGSQWTTPVVPQVLLGNNPSGNDERLPHIASDAGFTMITYTADDPATMAGGDSRVFAIWRCGGGVWYGPELIRTNTDTAKHQAMAYGRPGLVLNAAADVAHVVLLDGMTAQAPDDASNTNANLYWYRKPYVCQ